MKDRKLKINSGCVGCLKDCKWATITSSDVANKNNKYKCNGGK